MLVKFNENRMLHLFDTQSGWITIMPGVNKVDPAAWALLGPLDKNKALSHYLKEGTLELLQDSTLKDLPLDKAVKLVESTVSYNLLVEWQATEGRSKVRRAIDKQLENTNIDEVPVNH